MNEQTELLREMRDLLRVIAEPTLAKRDEKLRESLRGIVGKSKYKAKAVFLMDGSRTQATIQRESGAQQADVSRLVKGLREAGLINKNPDENPKLVIAIPTNFFEGDGA